MTKFFSATALLALATAPALAEEDVTVRYLAFHGDVAAHQLAQELGYYDGTPVSVERVGFSTGGPESLFALASGSVDVGSAATSAVLNAIAGGNDFVAAYPTNGIGEETQSVFYALEGSAFDSIDDIAGATIAVNTMGAHLDYTVREALHANGLPQNSVNLVTVPGPQLEQVLRSGQVDIAAFGYWQTTFEGAARAGGGLQRVFDDMDVLGEIAGGMAVLRRDWVQEHPEAAQAFVDGAARALDWSRAHPEETKELMAEILSARGENPEVAAYFAGYGVREGGRAVPQDIQFWIDVLEREGVIGQGQLSVETVLYDEPDATATN